MSGFGFNYIIGMEMDEELSTKDSKRVNLRDKHISRESHNTQQHIEKAQGSPCLHLQLN